MKPDLDKTANHMKHGPLLSLLLTPIVSMGQWQPTDNPNTQFVSLIARGDTIVAGTGGGGVIISSDGADTWLDQNTSSNMPYYIWSLMLEGDALYAGAMTGLYRSENGGAQWDLISDGLTGGLNDTSVYDILRDGNYLFTALGTGVHRSDDNGASWALSNSGISGGTKCLVKHGPYVFAGSAGAGVFRSATNGASWTEANVGLTGGNVQDLLSVGDELFLASATGIFHSSDNGDTWASVSNGLLNSNIYALMEVNGHLFAASWGGGVYTSTNNGASWSTLNAGLTNTTMTCLAKNDTYVYAGNFHNGGVPGDVWRQPNPAPTGISEQTGTSPFRLYPTLTTGSVTFEDASVIRSQRTVYVRDQTGRLVKEIFIGNSARSVLEIDASTGSYTVEVWTAAERKAVFRVIKCP